MAYSSRTKTRARSYGAKRSAGTRRKASGRSGGNRGRSTARRGGNHSVNRIEIVVKTVPHDGGLAPATERKLQKGKFS